MGCTTLVNILTHFLIFRIFDFLKFLHGRLKEGCESHPVLDQNFSEKMGLLFFEVEGEGGGLVWISCLVFWPRMGWDSHSSFKEERCKNCTHKNFKKFQNIRKIWLKIL